MAAALRIEKVFYAAVSILIAVATIWFFTHTGDIFRPLSIWRNVTLQTLLCALGLYFLSYILRGQRWLLLFKIPVRVSSLADFTGLVAIHAAAANILPLRSGEAVFPVLMARRGYPLTLGIVYLLAARLIDAAVMLSLAFIFYGGLKGALLVVVFLCAGVSLRSPFRTVLFWCIRKKSLVERLEPPISHLVTMPLRKVLSLATVTLLTWAVKLVAIAQLVSGFSGENLLASISCALGAELAFLLPLSGWLGLGNYEAGWLMVSELTGKLEADAAGLALFAHSFLLGSSILLGGVALFFEVVRGRRKST